jgi:hypothetical protein
MVCKRILVVPEYLLSELNLEHLLIRTQVLWWL